MKHCAFYHKESGVIHPKSVLLSDDKMLEANTPADHLPIDQPPTGPLDPFSQRVDIATGKVIDYQPPAPSPDHEWNPKTRRYQLNATIAAKQLDVATIRARISKMEAKMIRPLCEAILGVPDAIPKLRAIYQEVQELEKKLAPSTTVIIKEESP